MKNNVETAFEDIMIIKNSIEMTKRNTNMLFKIFLAIGIANVIRYGAIVFNIFAVRPNTAIFINTILNLTVYLILLMFYIRIYRFEKSNTNKFYISFLNLFAGITFLLPILLLGMRVILFLNESSEKIGDNMRYLQNIEMLSNILLLCFSIIIAGYILNKKGLLISSVIILIIYLLLSSLFSDGFINIYNSNNPITVSFYVMFYCLTVSIGYIIIGIIIKNQGEFSHGIK